MTKLLYKPLALGTSVLGGVLAGAVFKRVWKLIAHEDEVPQATDRERTWAEVLPAAALQGAVFAFVKAAVERSSAAGVERVTGTWPA